MANGSDLHEVFTQQSKPLEHPSPPPPLLDWTKIRGEWSRAVESGGGDSAAILRRVGELVVAFANERADSRRSIVGLQLPTLSWPQKALGIVTVNVETGERRVFDRDSGIELVDAIVATTTFWGSTPVFFQGHHYIDGGFHSSDNADLAVGFDQVIVFALRPMGPSLSLGSLDKSASLLAAQGSKVEVVYPDEASTEALTAGGPMNPSIREPLSKAGHTQGRRIAEKLWRFRDTS